MPSPLIQQLSVLAAKLEATVGTAETSFSGSDGAFNVYDVDPNPTTEFIDRDGQGSFSPIQGLLGPMVGGVSFRTDLIGGASAPAWMSTFLPACGWVDRGSNGIYLPTTSTPGTNGVKTLTIRFYEAGRLKQLRGCMGRPSLVFPTGKPVQVKFNFTGIWDAPVDGAIIAPTYPTTLPLKFVSAGLSLGGSFSPRVSEMTLDLGGDIFMREDENDPSGYISAMITKRAVTGKMDPEALLIASRDTYGIWKALTQQSFACTLGTTGNQIAFAGTNMQITKPAGAIRNGIRTDEIEFKFNRNTAAGDDEFSITSA